MDLLSEMIPKADILQAVSTGTALVSKPVLRWPREVMIYLGLSRTSSQRFIKNNGIKSYSYSDDATAKFVRRSDLDKALRICQQFKGAKQCK